MGTTAADMAAKRAARRAAGLCAECDTPAWKGHSLCRRHFDMREARLKKWNQKRSLAGRCYCGERVKPGRDRCPACLEIERERALERTQALKAAEKCVTRGRRRPVRGKVRCLRCALRAHGYYVDGRERQSLRLARRGQLAGKLYTLHAYSVR